MRCYQHKEREAAAFCKDCGRALCPECARQYTSLVCNPCNYANAARAKKGILLHWGRLLLGFAFGCWFFGMDAAIELHAVIGYMFMALVETLYVWNERDLMLGALVSSYAIVNMIFSHCGLPGTFCCCLIVCCAMCGAFVSIRMCRSWYAVMRGAAEACPGLPSFWKTGENEEILAFRRGFLSGAA